MPPQPIIETERLRLREFVEDDVAAYYAMCSDPAVTRYTHHTLASMDEALESMRSRPIADYRKYGYGRWACVLKENDQVIGFAGLKFLEDIREVDLGYRLLPPYWGRGLATEASRPIIDHGFDRLELKEIIGMVVPENVASVRVLQKLGFEFAGMMAYQGEQVARYVIRRREAQAEPAL